MDSRAEKKGGLVCSIFFSPQKNRFFWTFKAKRGQSPPAYAVNGMTVVLSQTDVLCHDLCEKPKKFGKNINLRIFWAKNEKK